MKNIANHIILSTIAITATNVFFVIWVLIDGHATRSEIVNGLSFFEFLGITNGAVFIISVFSVTYKSLGDKVLAWGYSNLMRGLLLVLLSVFVFGVACLLLFIVHFQLNTDFNALAYAFYSINNSYFLSLSVFFSLVSVLMFFISNLERRSGSIKRLLSQSMGQSLEPTLTNRGFIFIDLNDATRLAEKLSSETYADLLRHCFRLLNDLVAFSPFEIYQYVGDEAVLTWKTEIPNADVLALHLFSDFTAYLEEHRSTFEKAYGTQPKFKCAIHSGTVVQSEIGKEVKHLVYHGDVLNTASRLLSQCHFHKTDMIISKASIKNILKIEDNYHLEPIIYENLKGKENHVTAFIVKQKPMKAKATSKRNTNLFFETKVTNSQHLFNLKNTMKSIRKVATLAVFIGLLVSCGEEPNEGSKEEQKTPAPKTESSVQVIRKSDLKLQSITNGTVTSYVQITGRVIPKNTTQLVAEVQGRILSSANPFKAGTSYAKGQTMLRIDSREFVLGLESQKNAFLNILTSMMPDLKADYPDNYQNWLNYVSNYETGGALPALPQTTSDPEKYFVTSRQVYTTFYNIKAQEERLSKFTLRAPYSGSLSVALVDDGGLVSPGQPVGTFISNTVYEIESAVSIPLATKLKPGQKINFKSNGLDKAFTATVSRINDIVDPNTQNIPVFLSVSDADLRSGMYLEGQVNSGSVENAVAIPVEVVDRDNTVHILKDGIIRKVPITIVSTGNEMLTIRGLENNDQLILTTFENPISGLKITN